MNSEDWESDDETAQTCSIDLEKEFNNRQISHPQWKNPSFNIHISDICKIDSAKIASLASPKITRKLISTTNSSPSSPKRLKPVDNVKRQNHKQELVPIKIDSVKRQYHKRELVPLKIYLLKTASSTSPSATVKLMSSTHSSLRSTEKSKPENIKRKYHKQQSDGSETSELSTLSSDLERWTSNNQFLWVKPFIKKLKGFFYYQSFMLKGCKYSLGDFVRMQDETKKIYNIARIEAIWQAEPKKEFLECDSKVFLARWMYRPHDLGPYNYKNLDPPASPSELFFSHHCDENYIRAISGKVIIVWGKERENFKDGGISKADALDRVSLSDLDEKLKKNPGKHIYFISRQILQQHGIISPLFTSTTVLGSV